MFNFKKKEKAELLESHHKMKDEAFYFERIEQYFAGSDKSDVYQTITDRTYKDLDLDEVFMFADRTVSKVGQQYLYHVLRTIPLESGRSDNFEKLLSAFEEKPELKDTVVCLLFRLSKNEAYYIPTLFQEAYIQKPSWFWIVPLLSATSILLVLTSFVYPQLLLALLGILSINYLVHYWNKRNLYKYNESIIQLLVLNHVSKRLLKLDLVSGSDYLLACTKAVDSVGSMMAIFKLESKFQSELDSLFEVIRALFLLEPLLLFSVLEKLKTKKEDIHQLYAFVGEVDVALSISSLRKSLPYFSKPRLSEDQKHISAEGLYHPLLDNFVANSIEICGKSALLTGSNMSGKTTFIRTVGINVILSQTINTCFATNLVIPKLKVYSAIRISDDLMSEKSYYFEEVLTIKSMLNESESGMPSLFLLDEIFKGTNTVERIAAGKAVLSYLNKNDHIVFVSTHDLELAELLSDTYDLYHFTELVENEKIVFDYKLKFGNLKSTNAIRILVLNDYPSEVTSEAKKISIHMKNSNVANRA